MINVGIYTKKEMRYEAVLDVRSNKIVYPEYVYEYSRIEKIKGEIFWRVYLLNEEELIYWPTLLPTLSTCNTSDRMTFLVSDNGGTPFGCYVWASQDEIDHFMSRGEYRRFNAELYSETYEPDEFYKYRRFEDLPTDQPMARPTDRLNH